MTPTRPDRLTRLIPTVLGPVHAEATAEGITRLTHAGTGPDDDEPAPRRHSDHVHPDGAAEPAAPATDRAARHLDLIADQLEAYLDGELRAFSVPVDWDGASIPQGFAREVYREIQAVPYGQTAAYGQISHDAGRPRNARHVGRLCARVPVVFLIPVHRITRADGGLGACPGIRRGLLAHEKRNIESAETVAITAH